MATLIHDHLGRDSIVGGMRRIEGTEELATVYYGQYRTCVRAALFNLPDGETMHYVFAAHPEVSAVALREYHAAVMAAYAEIRQDVRVGTIAFAKADSLGPLQAADLVAWQFRRHVENPSENRPAFQLLMSLRPHIYQ